MKKFAKTIVDLRYALMLLFVAAAAVCGWAMTKVNTNYDIVSYLPESTDTVQTLAKMEEQFGAVGTAQVMVKMPADGVNALKKKLENIEGMQTVVAGTDEASYRDGWALFKLFLTDSSFSPEAKETVDSVREALADYDEIAMNGGAVSSKFLQTSIVTDMIVIMIVACLVIAIILLLTSTSWIDPVIFAIVVAVSLLINLGTNAILHDVSFITKAICAIMQLALAMDYSIILLHRFNEERERTLDIKEAMVNAIAGSFTSVAASSLTTIAGLVALMFMRFTIGLDVGIVLTKGIVISLFSVFFFMPGVIMLFAPVIQKSKHKTLQQFVGEKSEARHAKKQAQFDAAAQESGKKPKKAMTYIDFAFKARKVVPLILIALLVAGAVMNFNVEYSYQLKTSKNPDDAVNVENQKIEDVFGKQNSLVVLVPTGDLDKEKEVVDFMLNYEYKGEKVVNGAQGMAALGFAAKIPSETLKKYLNDDDVGKLLNMCGYSADAESIRIYDIIRIVSKAKQENDISSNDEMKFLSAWVQRALKAALNVLDLVGEESFDASELAGELTAAFTPISTKIAVSETLVASLYEKCGFEATDPVAIGELLTAFSEKDVTAELFPEGGTIAKLLKTAVDTVVPLLPKLHNELTLAEIGELLPVDGIAEKLEPLFKIYGVQKASVVGLLRMFSGTKPNGGNPSFTEGIASGTARGRLVEIVQPTISLAFTMFESGNEKEPMSRLMFNLNMQTANDDSFAAMKEITAGVRAIYGDQKIYIACETAAYADIKDNFLLDSTTINLISFFAIFLIVAISFLSLGVPVILTLLIQGATWLGMAMQFMAGNTVFFVCYLVVMCIQMGATVDYAILLTNRYIECRYRKNRIDAMKEAFGTSVMTVMTSGSILVIAAFIVGMVSKVAIIADLGVMLSIGCLVSLCIILFALPEVLFCLDKFIEKTSIRKKGKRFLKDGETVPVSDDSDNGNGPAGGSDGGSPEFISADPVETNDPGLGLEEVAGSGASEISETNAPTLCGLPEIRRF